MSGGGACCSRDERTSNAAIIRLYFGLDGGKPMNIEEIDRALGLDTDDVRRIRTESMAMLRNAAE